MTTEDVIMYQDFHMRKPWRSAEYKVEFDGNKARVHNDGFGPSVSRFNKLYCSGHTTKYHYALTVNGKRAYFMANYKIPTK